MSAPSALDFYDAELRAHHEHLRAASGIRPGDDVVDIGCGTGLTPRSAARPSHRRRAVSSASTSPRGEERGMVFDSRSWLITARRSARPLAR